MMPPPGKQVSTTVKVAVRAEDNEQKTTTTPTLEAPATMAVLSRIRTLPACEETSPLE